MQSTKQSGRNGIPGHRSRTAKDEFYLQEHALLFYATALLQPNTHTPIIAWSQNSRTQDFQGSWPPSKVISGWVMYKMIFQYERSWSKPHTSSPIQVCQPGQLLTSHTANASLRKGAVTRSHLRWTAISAHQILCQWPGKHSTAPPSPKGAMANTPSTSGRSLNKKCMEKCIIEFWWLAQQILAIVFDRMCSSNYFCPKFLYLIQRMWRWNDF